jgi:hypothetical protein
MVKKDTYIIAVLVVLGLLILKRIEAFMNGYWDEITIGSIKLN